MAKLLVQTKVNLFVSHPKYGKKQITGPHPISDVDFTPFSRSSWPRGRKPGSCHRQLQFAVESSTTAELPPVLLLPGISDTVLQAVFDETNEVKEAWVGLKNSDVETLLWSKYNPETATTESLEPGFKIVVPQDNHGLFAIDYLSPNPGGFWGLVLWLGIMKSQFLYYHALINELKTWGYKEGVNLFGFGYDYRQSNRWAPKLAQLKQKVEGIRTTTGKKVNIISHSMGGLVTRSFLALHKEAFADNVASWTAIAAPFRGAPGMTTDTLLAGPRFVSKFMGLLTVRRWTERQLLAQCPSLFEMITQYDDFEWNETPKVRIIYKNIAADGSILPSTVETIDSTEDLINLLSLDLGRNEVTLNGKKFDISVHPDMLSWILETKKLMSSAELPTGVKFYNIYGLGKDTPFHITYGTPSAPIDPTSNNFADCPVAYDYVDGDGTVPYESSTGDGFDATARFAVPADHTEIIKREETFKILKSILLS